MLSQINSEQMLTRKKYSYNTVTRKSLSKIQLKAKNPTLK